LSEKNPHWQYLCSAGPSPLRAFAQKSKRKRALSLRGLPN
jgi:hypothetical protein